MISIDEQIFQFDNFLTDDECKTLFNWTMENRTTNKFRPIMMGGQFSGRVSTRFSESNVPFPPLVGEIRQRIDALTGFDEYRLPPFDSGVYSGICHLKNDSYYELHRDPTYYDMPVTVHCNIVVNDTVGGDVFTRKKIVEMKKGRLVIMPVSYMEHGVTVLAEDMPRNLWVFGYCLNYPVWSKFLKRMSDEVC